VLYLGRSGLVCLSATNFVGPGRSSWNSFTSLFAFGWDLSAMAMLSEEYLKLAAGEFDLKTIFQLILREKSIKRIEGAVDQCINIRWLDLSQNGIIKLENMSRLANLQFMDLSHNKLQKIQNLDGLKALHTLRLLNNPIFRLQDLEGLRARRPSLKHLSLKQIDGSEACPVCLTPLYKEKVYEELPNLYALDSQRKHLPELFFDEKYLIDPQFEMPEPQDWLKSGDCDLDGLFDEAEVERKLRPKIDEFEKALAECRAALDEGDELLRKAGIEIVGP
jgi:Leucine-rich repeat (LRR) protein